MERLFLKKATRYLLRWLRQLKLQAVKIIREVLDFFFLITALFLAVPGLYRLMEELRGRNFVDSSSMLLTVWLSLAIMMAVAGYFLANMRLRFVLIFSHALFTLLITGLGFLAYGEKYFYFLGIYFALSVAIRVIPRVYKRMRIRAMTS